MGPLYKISDSLCFQQLSDRQIWPTAINKIYILHYNAFGFTRCIRLHIQFSFSKLQRIRSYCTKR